MKEDHPHKLFPKIDENGEFRYNFNVMPIYEFICKTCSEHFEVLTTIGGEKKVVCLLCGSRDIRKLFSSFGIGGRSNRLGSSYNGCSSCSSKSCNTCK